MKVLYDLEAYSFAPHGGVTRIFDEVIRRFNQRDDFSALYYRHPHALKYPPTGPHTSVTRLTCKPDMSEAHPLKRKLYHGISSLYWRTHPSDIFHPTFYPRGLELLKRTSIINIYDLTHEEIEQADGMLNHKLFLELKRRAVEHAQRIICISEATHAAFLKHYPSVDPEITRVVYPGYNENFQLMNAGKIEDILSQAEIQLDQPFLLYVGSRQRYKNFHRLLQAYQSWSQCRDVDLVVVGGSPDTMDKAYHDLTSGPGKVTYINFPSDRTLCALYNRAACFIYPSLSEGFGIPLLEAMSAGCPICISDIPVFHEVADDAAIYFDPYSTDAIRNALDQAILARNLPKIEQRQQQRLSQFSWDQCAQDVWKVYQELI